MGNQSTNCAGLTAIHSAVLSREGPPFIIDKECVARHRRVTTNLDTRPVRNMGLEFTKKGKSTDLCEETGLFAGVG